MCQFYIDGIAVNGGCVNFKLAKMLRIKLALTLTPYLPVKSSLCPVRPLKTGLHGQSRATTPRAMVLGRRLRFN